MSIIKKYIRINLSQFSFNFSEISFLISLNDWKVAVWEIVVDMPADISFIKNNPTIINNCFK